MSALNSITPKDITALKALKNPPDIVKRIFNCVLLLRWGASALPLVRGSVVRDTIMFKCLQLGGKWAQPRSATLNSC